MIHDNVFYLSLVLMGGVFFAFAFVALQSGKVTEYALVQAKAYKNRSRLFWVIIIAGIGVSIGTTRLLPYDATQEGAVTDLSIDVEGRQWYWVLSQDHAPVNTTVTFNVTSGDVNHGFGIYDKDLRLLSQTQAMPGYLNKLEFTFNKSGEYQLMCLEYCGLAHHAMISKFNVNPVSGDK